MSMCVTGHRVPCITAATGLVDWEKGVCPNFFFPLFYMK